MFLKAGRVLEYLRLARFDRPAGALLLLWPTLWGLWLAAEGWPGWKWLAVFAAGVFMMRAFGCVVNDIADRKLDAAVERTKNRPLAAGRVTVWEAVVVAFVFLFAAFFLWLFLPSLSRRWAFFAVALAAVYPFAKRFLRAPQMVLGIAFGFGIPMAWTAVRNETPGLEVWLLMAGNFLWVFAYDTVYAMSDREGDIRAGAGSSAVLFGARDVVFVSVFYAAAVLWLSALGIVYDWGVAYQVALIAAMALVFRFYFLYRTRAPERCLAAFRANNWFGAFVFAGFAAAFA